MMKEIQSLLTLTNQHLNANTFVKLTLSKSRIKNGTLNNVYIRFILLKNSPHLSFTYRYHTNDQVKNYLPAEGLKEIQALMEDTFFHAVLFTTTEEITLLTSQKGVSTLKTKHTGSSESPSVGHDREKLKRAQQNHPYLQLLGITDANGSVIPKMADKFRQINKYLEIIDGLIRTMSLPEHIHIVDMGSGKGYLTFALYEYLTNTLQRKVTVSGIELRQDLVDFCNQAAKDAGFESLHFYCEPIQSYSSNAIDILIALHACDTATDDAIQKGILSNAGLIICAPCCHKQIRQQVKGVEQENPLMKYGIFKEREFEMVTDTIRALILEQHQYQTKIFEFISNEHTRKNIMLVAAKTPAKADIPVIAEKIDRLKKSYHIDFHYLEKLV